MNMPCFCLFTVVCAGSGMWHLGILTKLLALLLFICYFANSEVSLAATVICSISPQASCCDIAMTPDILCVCCCCAGSQGFFQSLFSVWPISKLFELDGSIHEWWFRWKLDRFVSA